MILPCAAGEGDHAQHGGGGEIWRRFQAFLLLREQG